VTTQESPTFRHGECQAEEQFDIADEFSIMSVPTMLFYKNGSLINKTIGVTSKERINQMFE